MVWVCFAISSYGQPEPKRIKLNGRPTFRVTDGVAEINSDSDNNLWIVYFNNLVRYDGSESVYINTFGVNNKFLHRFYEKEDGEKLVIDQLNQLFYIEADTLRASPLNDTLKALSKGQFCSDFYFDHEERLHIAFPGIDYFIIDSNLQVRRPFKGLDFNGVICAMKSDRKPFIAKMVDRSLGPEADGFLYLLSEEGTLVNKYPIGEFTGKYPTAITQLVNDNFLFSTGNNELFEFNETGTLEKVDYDRSVIGLLVDSNNGLWISTENGIDYYQKGVINEADKQLLMENTFSVASHEDFHHGVWIGSQPNGLNIVPLPLCASFSEGNGLIEDAILAIELKGNKLLTGGPGENLKVLNLNSFEKSEIPIPSDGNSVYDIRYDPGNERIWLALSGRLLYFNEGKWNEHWISQMGYGDNRYELDGNTTDTSIGFVGYAGPRFFYTKDTALIISEPYEHNISSVLLHGDSIFVGTMGGLYLEVSGKRTAMFRQIPKLKKVVSAIHYFNNKAWINIPGDGLFILEADTLTPVLCNGNKIQKSFLIPEGNSHLWAINAYGNFMISPPLNKSEGRSYEVELFTALPTLSGHAFCYDHKSVFWAVREKEVLKMDFDDMRQYPGAPPSLAITEFLVNGKRLSLNRDFYQFAHDENFLTISYHAASYIRTRVMYRYRVRGLQDAWTVTDEKKLQLLGLPPGTYDLEIQAQIAQRRWGETRGIAFEIIAPFWKRGWFIAMSIILSLMIIYLLVSYRIQMLNREKKLILERLMADQKALKAQLNPHFIFNAINSVQYFIRAGRNTEAEAYVGLFADLARLVLENSEKRLVSFSQEMQLYTSQISLESMVLPNGEYIDLVFDVDGVDTDKVFVPPALLQPYIENAVWHGLRRRKGEKRIEIKLEVEEEMLLISVTDNGIGRDAARRMKPKGKAVKSFGMKISSQRIDVMNQLTNNSKSVVKIEDLMNEDQEALGTKIILKISLIQSDEISNS